MDMTTANIEESLKHIDKFLNDASQLLDENPGLGGPNGYDVPEMLAEYYIESAFIHTLVLLDRINLSRTYEILNNKFQKAKKEGLLIQKQGPDDPYLVWSSTIYSYLSAIGNSYNIDLFSSKVASDVISIIRSSLYSITDKEVFDSPPINETEVHNRIEAVLKCIFQDLKRKPSISKPIKNFIPDTGLPSVKTLIEYKFASTKDDAKRIADEILADTRGYHSKDWEKFLYVLYETNRIQPESDWNNLLKECGIPDNTRVIVLSGEPK